MTSEPRLVADRYELGELLGRGGMADVHRATDRVLHRDVAVKVLRDTADDESDRLRFIAEARTLARLSHPGLVMVLDAGTTAERPYLVMELVEGQTLAQCCSGSALPAARVAAVGTQLADALAYAHHQGVVHRDVKPGNVLLDGEDRVKLADFGIARLIGDTVRHTQTGQAIGTAAYLAPEQVQGREVTPAADVYSLALLLLEALTGERSFPGAPTEAALARLQRAPAIPDWLSEEWRTLLAAATALDPAQRPPAAQVAERLARLAGTTPTACAAPTGPPPAAPPPASPASPGSPASPASPASPMSATAVAGPAPDATLVMSRSTPATERRPAAAAGPSPLARARAAAGDVPAHLWGVIGAVAAIVVVLVVVSLAAGGGSGNGERGIPADTPAQLRQPLQDLHDAVQGGGS